MRRMPLCNLMRYIKVLIMMLDITGIDALPFMRCEYVHSLGIVAMKNPWAVIMRKLRHK